MRHPDPRLHRCCPIGGPPGRGIRIGGNEAPGVPGSVTPAVCGGGGVDSGKTRATGVEASREGEGLTTKKPLWECDKKKHASGRRITQIIKKMVLDLS